jgi:hypothetical protein
LLVRLRPNAAYAGILLIGVSVVVYGVFRSDAVGVVIAVAGGVFLVLLGYPVVLSTVFRVPVMAIDRDGIRLPLMGVRLRWHEVRAVKRTADLRGPAGSSVLLIIPTDAKSTLSQARPWLRRELRANLTRHGTPVVLTGRSLDRSLDEITAAIHTRSPS